MVILYTIFYMLVAILATAMTTVLINNLYQNSKASDKKIFFGVATLIMVLLCLLMTAFPLWYMTKKAEEALSDYAYGSLGGSTYDWGEYDFGDIDTMEWDENSVVDSVDLMAE